MNEFSDLDPLFDTSLGARSRRFVSKMLDSRFFLIAILFHGLILILFGGKVIFESFKKVNLESESILAPKSETPSLPPPSVQPEKTIDVKVNVPQNNAFKSRIAIDKLSTEFTVAAPDISSSISVSMEGISSGGGGSSSGGGTGFAQVSFFGISTKVSKIIYLTDISGSMMQGEKIGHSYDEVVAQVSKGVHALTSSNEFNIITFAKTGIPYKPQMVQAFGSEKAAAITWFKKLSPGAGLRDYNGVERFHAGTRADIALDQALQQKPDMIMFVSDGLPTNFPGGPTALLDQVKKWQAQYGTHSVINTVYYKTGDNAANVRAKDFMMKLAEDSGGQYRAIE